MSDNYYDCMHRVWTILKNTKDISFIIDNTVYKINKHRLYIYISYKWYLKPLTSMNFEKLSNFEEDLKNILGVIE